MKSDSELQEWGLSLARELSIPEPNTGCWLWEGSAFPGGYARVHHLGNQYLVTRLIVGLIRHEGRRSGLCALHRCDTPMCVNPEHLFRGTRRDNMRDMTAKGRRRGTFGDSEKIRNIRTRRTHCKRGHAMTDDNIILTGRSNPAWKPGRSCKRCHSLHSQRNRKKSEAQP